MARRSNRRDFLRGKAGLNALDPLEPAEAESYLTRVGRGAMACQFEVLLNAGQYPSDMIAALEALDVVERLEAQLSYFQPTSEISRINDLAAQQPVEVDASLFELLELSLQLCRQTDGALDITASPLWEIWGFARRAGRIPRDDEIDEAMQSVGSQWVELDRERHTVRFLRPGVKVSLGSIGKGYALDRAAEVMAASGIGDFLLHGGQSSVLARGSCQHTQATGPSEAPGGWTVGIRHPLRRNHRLAEIRLHDQALGTSNSAVQSFRHGGRRYGHILDPRTGRPAEGLLSVTVLAPTAALADALATALFVMGEEAARAFCGKHPEISAVLAVPGRGGMGLDIRPVGVPAEQLSHLAPH